MIAFLRSRTGLSCIIVFLVFMGFMTHRVLRKSAPSATSAGPQSTVAAPVQKSKRVPQTKEGDAPSTAEEALASRSSKPRGDVEKTSEPKTPPQRTALQQTLTQLDQVSRLTKQSRTERDRSGQPVTRRKTPSEVPAAGNTSKAASSGAATASLPATGGSLRLTGRTEPPSSVSDELAAPGSTETARHASENATEPSYVSTNRSVSKSVSASVRHVSDEDRTPPKLPSTTPALLPFDTLPPGRFAPYGRPIKCELVFTLDSTLEETPIVALVVEPVYNNGHLVLPAGAELHGRARPDRLRDRIFSAKEWMLVLPREGTLLNGRQLPVLGHALDRAEPEGRGDTWGITDGSFGFQGEVIRTMNEEEIRQFAAVFLSTGALALQERQGGVRSQRSVLNTPANAALAGAAATLNQIARQIADEIAKNGVFIRVPAGKQFYFYPLQAIAPDRAALPAEASPRRTSHLLQEQSQ